MAVRENKPLKLNIIKQEFIEKNPVMKLSYKWPRKKRGIFSLTL